VLEEAIAPKEAIAQLRKCTEEVVLSGTGKHIQSPHYTIAGKTGTAQVADKGIPYSAGVYQGSFVGYFPADDPKYTMIVVIRTKPHSNAYYGGTIAAPVFRMVADKIFANGMGSQVPGPVDSLARSGKQQMVMQASTVYNYQLLMKTLQQPFEMKLKEAAMAQINMDSTNRISTTARRITKGQVPDVTGMALKDAVYILEQQGLHIQVSGKGAIQSQSIPPGSQVVKGQTIIIQLS
jgi:cell division protein FtsI (penicillin-binding protein 3)